MRVSRIPNTLKLNITLSDREMDDLDEELYRATNECSAPLPRINELLFLVEDARNSEATDDENYGRMLYQEASMSFMEAILFIAKKMKIVVSIDTESETFISNKKLWDCSSESQRIDWIADLAFRGELVV